MGAFVIERVINERTTLLLLIVMGSPALHRADPGIFPGGVRWHNVEGTDGGLVSLPQENFEHEVLQERF